MDLSGIQLPSNRKFGFFFTGVLVIAGAYFLNQATMMLGYSLLGLAAVFLLVTLVKADLLLPLNKLWMRFGLLLGMVVSPIVLGVIFFGLFTPISVLMRLFGRDELRLNLKSRDSYWKERQTETAQKDAFKYQF